MVVDPAKSWADTLPDGSYVPNYALDGSWGPITERTERRVTGTAGMTTQETRLRTKSALGRQTPHNVEDFFQTGVTLTNNVSVTVRQTRALSA